MFLSNIVAITTISVLSLGFPYSRSGGSSMPLASHEIPLYNRQPDRFVNEVFKDNILLNLAYMDNKISNKDAINWTGLEKDARYSFTLKPAEVFSYHEDVLDKYQGRVAKTTNAHFNYSDGFKSDGYLYGDGVCHLASLIYWAAKDAGLEAEAPTNHNFAQIPDIPREYGVSIFNTPGNRYSNSMQNLYISNNRQKDIRFDFEYQNDRLKITILEVS